MPLHVWFSREMKRVSPSPFHLLQQNSAGSQDVLGAVVPLLLIIFPAFQSKGPQNMDLFNLTTPSTSHTGAEMMPRVKEDPMAGGNGSPRLQAPRPGSKPSPLLLAPREGASMGMPGSSAIHGGLPELGLGGGPGAVGARTGSHHDCCAWSGSFLQGWKCPGRCGQGEGAAWAQRQRAVAPWAPRVTPTVTQS